MPEAARISDMHSCPKVEPGPVPHVGGPVFAGSGNVLIGYLPAARVGDAMVCFPVGPSDSIKAGAATVLINHCSAARRTDPGSHIGGDLIVQGCPTVLIGDVSQTFPMLDAAARGTTFCEECARAEGGPNMVPAEAAAPAADTDTVTLADGAPLEGNRDALTNLGVSREELATQANGDDELDDVRRAARQAVAFQFYLAHAGPTVKPAGLWSHIGALDATDPVTIVEVSGMTLYQRGFPGGRPGEYFASDKDATPEQLGASTNVGVVDSAGARTLAPRDHRIAEFGAQPAKGLQSTAAKIDDWWSIGKTATLPNTLVPCVGGATQIMIPRVYHAGATISPRVLP
ncbi:MAG: PAAR domain-containing protein [Nannocystis sp.]|nr:PAAR domain-containing protein [Nannocystis sp.]MBA3544993.1 PAAR domain-containing protein [Nannocystis sp.]